MEKEKILIDTNVFVAYFYENDSLHESTNKVIHTLRKEKYTFFTNNYLVSEVFTMLLYKIKDAQAVGELAKNFYSITNTMNVEQITVQVQKQALEIFSQQRTCSLSFIDCILISQSISSHIRYIATFDKDIRKHPLLKRCTFLPSKM